ncbi:hypothetical protein MBLNU230_g6755t1 [Neophaeotheca triangularis]
MTSPTAPNPPFALQHTNVSQPSIHHQKSQQSFTASEDYYSVSGSGASSSTYSGENAEVAVASTGSPNPLRRHRTTTERYRTPAQSQAELAQHHVPQRRSQEEFRRTPMRGEGKRRADPLEGSKKFAPVAVPAPLQMREGGIKRKPVPGSEEYQQHESAVSPTIRGYSSAAQQLDREGSPQTPGAESDMPYIRFAIDQLTRDEEVRGSRRYGGVGPRGSNTYRGVQAPRQSFQPDPLRSSPVYPENQYHQFPTIYNVPHVYDDEPQAQADDPLLERDRDVFNTFPPRTPPKNPKRNAFSKGNLRQQGMPEEKLEQPPAVFVPVGDDPSRPKLNFRPAILRPLWLGVFILLLLLYIVALIVCAALSVTGTPGLWDYGSFGDGRYFVFEYLPTLLGMVLLLWLFQIEIAVYRIAPFIAMSSDNAHARDNGANLPLCPSGFILPELRHFKARQPVVGLFFVIAWLNLFTIPLLASSFNVYFVGAPDTGRFRWIATQGAIWVVIGLYVLLAVACVALLAWFSRQRTGLKWDPRSLADMICLLARSNALDGDDIRREPAQLGYWRTSRHSEVFHTYGVPDKEARQYDIEEGRIREKRSSSPPLRAPVSRFSSPDMDIEASRPLRESNDQMLRRSTATPTTTSSLEEHTNILPWYLRLSSTLLWAILALLLLLAFLIVSYLPSTQVSTGFTPLVPPFVSTTGFSSTNFLYSFLPTLLALLCLLLWLPLDLAHRRLKPYFTLSATLPGANAETSLLLSYPSDLPLHSTAQALSNSHHRLALITLNTLIAATLPVLASGCFWAQFSLPRQATYIFSHGPAYHALSAFLTLYALGYCLAIPAKSERAIYLPTSQVNSFAGVRDVVGRSRMLDDYAWFSPVSKTGLVTRLVSGFAGVGGKGGAAAGEGRARFALGRFAARDGGEVTGVERV